MPKKKTSQDKPSKSDFIRSQPDATALQVIARGKDLGIVIKESQVYNVRTADRKRAVSRVQPARVTNPLSPRSVLEAQLRSTLLRLGLDRSEEILSELKSSLNPIVSNVVPNTRWKPLPMTAVPALTNGATPSN